MLANNISYNRQGRVAIAKEYPQMQAEFTAEDQVYLATGVVLDSYMLYNPGTTKLHRLEILLYGVILLAVVIFVVAMTIGAI
ncbi:hypothetical protein AAFN47_27585 [Hoeflea sp. CAU 1731]